ncbi:MAG TPA: diguanylate cyclase [Desulfobacterales bacterium]
MASPVLEQQWLDRIQSLEESLQNCRETLETVTGPKTKYDFVLEGTSEGLMLLDCNHQIADVNQALLRTSGYRRSELIGRSVLALYDKDAMVFHSASPDHLKFEAPLKSRYGRQIPMLFSRSIFREERGEIAGYMIFLTDLTELKATQAELERAERRYRAMYENAVQAMFQSRLSGELIRVNPSYARIFGYESPEEVLALPGGSRDFYFHPEDRQRMIRAVRKNGAVVNFELCLKRKDGKPVWILANVRLIRKSRRNSFLEGILVDNTKNKKLEEKLRRERRKFQNLAVRDNLTGLYNTRYLYRALDDLILQSNATGTVFSLLFMDMDNFKKVVDAHGHLNGSRALSEVARTIKASIRRPCFGVAYGGDEFVIVLPGFSKSRARRKAEHIRSRMKKTDYLESEGLRVKLSASIGLATFPDDIDNRTGLLALADKAMFRIKQNRKDAVGTVA